MILFQSRNENILSQEEIMNTVISTSHSTNPFCMLKLKKNLDLGNGEISLQIPQQLYLKIDTKLDINSSKSN